MSYAGEPMESCSLCVVKDRGDRLMLYRLADVEDGNLVNAWGAETDPLINQNRTWVYFDSSEPEFTVGVWRWTAIPNNDRLNKYHIRSNRDYVDPTTRIFIFKGFTKVATLIAKLQEGVKDGYLYDGTTLFAFRDNLNYKGVLCKSSDLKRVDGLVKLKETVCSLQVYEVTANSILHFGNLSFSRNIKQEIGLNRGRFIVGETRVLIKNFALEHFNRAQYGGSRDEWNSFKRKLDKLRVDSFCDYVAQRLQISTDKAREYVDDFIRHTNDIIKQGDFDEAILERIALNNDKLRTQCEIKIEEKLRESHKAKIEEAEQALAVELQNIERRKNFAQDEFDLARAKHSVDLLTLEESIDAKKKEFDEKSQEIKNLCKEFDDWQSWFNDSFEEAQKKFADLRNDPNLVANALLLQTLLQTSIQSPSIKSEDAKDWKYIVGEVAAPIEETNDWNDEFDLIKENLRAFNVCDEFLTMLAAFLYSAFVNKAPLLVAGPFAYEIADAVSVAVSGTRAGRLRLGNAGKVEVAELADYVANVSESTVVVENMFGSSWSDELPQALSRCGKLIVWSRPYVEDLPIEPKGLYNYATPLFSECFVEIEPDGTPSCAGKRTPTFKNFSSNGRRQGKIEDVKNFGLSGFAIGRLYKIISDAKQAVKENDDSDRQKEMEILFGTLPFAVLTRRTDVLKEIARSNKKFSNRLTAEIARYAED